MLDGDPAEREGCKLRKGLAIDGAGCVMRRRSVLSGGLTDHAISAAAFRGIFNSDP
jgi:hypothetical protein